MKRQFANVSLISCILIVSACHKTDDSTGSTNNQNVTSGVWHITLFKDSGNDETADFSGYTFAFNSNGSLDAVKSGSSKTGTWSSGSKFIIDLGAKGDTNKPLGELTDDWHIISITADEIKLGDDNPASGELLTFSKN
jgi:hypothetical protein